MDEKKIQTGELAEPEQVDGGGWTIDGELGLLTDRSGCEARLEPRLSRLMLLLLSNNGRFVSRRELIDRMWPDSVVSDQSLTRAVADLRKVLRANYDEPPVIDTASKQGYRLDCSERINRTGGPSRSLPRTGLRLLALGMGALALLVLVIRGLSY